MTPSDQRNSTRQRVVILPGPHKTGSSSVQLYLAQLHSSNQIGDWVWPAKSSKSFAPLVESILFDKEDKNEILERKKNRIASAWFAYGKSIVIGAELFDFMAAMSPKELPGVFQRLKSLLPKKITAEVVVMYRTPRTSHLVSAWKQQLAMAEKGIYRKPWRFQLETGAQNVTEEQPSLAEWLCSGQWEGHTGFNVDKILAAQVNPMGVAHAFYRYGNMNVTVADMVGIDDLPNMVACEILNVPCTDKGKVVGLEDEQVLIVGDRSNPTTLGLSDGDMNEVEEILRRMDCYYYCGLRSKIAILHGNDAMFTEKEGWKDCCETPEEWLSPMNAYEKLKVLGCKAASTNAVVSHSKVTAAWQVTLNEPEIVAAESLGLPVFAVVLILALFVSFFRLRRKQPSKET